jgi:hypothetical protein
METGRSADCAFPTVIAVALGGMVAVGSRHGFKHIPNDLRLPLLTGWASVAGAEYWVGWLVSQAHERQDVRAKE